MKLWQTILNFWDVILVSIAVVIIAVLIQKTDLEHSVVSGISTIHKSVEDVLYLVRGEATADETNKKTIEEEKKALEAEVASLLYLKEENESLKSMLGLAQEKSLQLVEANVLVSDSFGLRGALMIDKGSVDGVQVGQEVLSGGVLVGVIAEVKEQDAVVKLISDMESKIAGVVANANGSQGIVKSKFGNELKLEMVPQSEKVEEGQFVMTSGLDGLMAGLPIGKIIRVNEGESFYDISIERSVDFYKMRKVFVLTL